MCPRLHMCATTHPPLADAHSASARNTSCLLATGSIAAAGGETGFGRDSTKTRSCTLSLLGHTAHYEKKTLFDVITLAAVLLRAEAQLFQLSRVAGLGHCNEVNPHLTK